MIQKILIIEDDLLVAELERDYLEAAGFETEICTNGTEGMHQAQKNIYALLLLDVMLPSTDGWTVCREIRKTSNMPIIMVTARKEDIDKIRGLGLGADDYIVNPFSPSELVARVQAHIRMHERLLQSAQPAPEQKIHIRNLEIFLSQRKVLINGEEILFKNKEFELLVFLASHPDIVFSKETLLDRIWGEDSLSDTATVTVHINRIREKIEKNQGKPEYIQTVWGTGYRFIR